MIIERTITRMEKEFYNTIKEKVEKLELLINGGKGSGNFGHSGRPGYIGGSGDGKGNPDILRIVDVLKEDKSYDLHDMSPEMVVELMGEETIHKDNLEDLQHYIDRAASEMSALEAEADEEFGPIPKKEKSDGLKEIADEHRVKVEELSSKGNLSAEEQQELRVEQRRYAQVQMERLVKAPYHEGKGYVELDGKHFTLGEREMADAVLAYPQYIDLPMFTALREKLIKNEVDAVYNGGKGSGNFGHSGRPGEVGGSGDGGGKFSKGDEVTFYQYGENHKGKIVRKISEKEKQDRADLNNPNAGDYYEVEIGSGDFASKSIVWEGRIKKAEKQSKGEKRSGEVSLKGKSLYEKVHMIQPGDEVHITPKDNLPNFDRKIKVDYIQDGTIHYGSSETSDGYTYPAWAIKDITKIVRKKKNSIYAELSRRLDEIEKMINGGKGSGNFGHAGRPGMVGGSGDGGNIKVHEGSKEMDYFYAEDGDRILASGKTKEEALAKAKEAVRKMGEELRKKSPVRKQDEWFVDIQEVEREYKERGEEIRKAAEKVAEKIYGTDEPYTGSKKDALSFIMEQMHATHESSQGASDSWIEDSIETLRDFSEDYRYVKSLDSKRVKITQNPMSATGVVYDKADDTKRGKK